MGSSLKTHELNAWRRVAAFGVAEGSVGTVVVAEAVGAGAAPCSKVHVVLFAENENAAFLIILTLVVVKRPVGRVGVVGCHGGGMVATKRGEQQRGYERLTTQKTTP